MTRTKRKARRRVAASSDDEPEEEAEASNVMAEEEEYQHRPLESNDDEIQIIGNLEEADYVVSAVMQVECDFQAPQGRTLAENSESDNLDKTSADPSRSYREAAEEELEPPSNGVCLEQNLMNDECPSTEVKDMELPNRYADDVVIDMDEEEGKGQEMLEEMKGDDYESDEKSKDGVVNELPLTSAENQESQVDQRKKVSLQVKTIYIEGAPKSWNADKLRDICERFGEIKNVEVSRNLNRKGQDFGFIAFTAREYALACVEGINGREFEGNLKVKAYIARPLSRKWFPKVNHGGFIRRHKRTAGLKIAKTDRTEVSKMANVSEREMRNALLAHEAEEKATSLLDKTGQDVPVIGTREIETKNYEGDIPLTAEVAMPSRRRRNRKRKRRNRGKDMRASKEQKGYSQEQTGVSSRKPRRKSHLRKRQKLAAVSNSIGSKPKGYIPRQVHIPVHRSKNIHSEMESHARYIKIEEQHNPAGWRVPASRCRQLHDVNARPVVHKGGQPHSSFQKNFAGNDALPHAGYVELVGKHHFSNHVVRRNVVRRLWHSVMSHKWTYMYRISFCCSIPFPYFYDHFSLYERLSCMITFLSLMSFF